MFPLNSDVTSIICVRRRYKLRISRAGITPFGSLPRDGTIIIGSCPFTFPLSTDGTRTIHRNSLSLCGAPPAFLLLLRIGHPLHSIPLHAQMVVHRFQIHAKCMKGGAAIAILSLRHANPVGHHGNGPDNRPMEHVRRLSQTEQREEVIHERLLLFRVAGPGRSRRSVRPLIEDEGADRVKMHGKRPLDGLEQRHGVVVGEQLFGGERSGLMVDYGILVYEVGFVCEGGDGSILQFFFHDVEEIFQRGRGLC
mmetsp:Transcript_24485/g.51946  ORF Transcript_24485/g.51946 Transcript_24485/m.51946 type:complete len:252 (-) Transcript_24485:861-1616(-)